MSTESAANDSIDHRYVLHVCIAIADMFILVVVLKVNFRLCICVAVYFIAQIAAANASVEQSFNHERSQFFCT